jgi:hypothetical protein
MRNIVKCACGGTLRPVIDSESGLTRIKCDSPTHRSGSARALEILEIEGISVIPAGRDSLWSALQVRDDDDLPDPRGHSGSSRR